MGHHNKRRNQYRHPKASKKMPSLSITKTRPQSVDIGSKLKMMELSKPHKKTKDRKQPSEKKGV